MTPQFVVVGSGPAGLYCAEKLLRDAPQARIDIIEKLPTPFGLVRAGVAPDHQGTKAVTRVFERLLRREEVAFFGNVEIGRDVTLAELRPLYDAVIIATGALHDRRLGISGDDLPGVFGSGAFSALFSTIRRSRSGLARNILPSATRPARPPWRAASAVSGVQAVALDDGPPE